MRWGFEVQRAILRRELDDLAQGNIETLKAAWRAVVRSHRLLDLPVYKPTGGRAAHHGASRSDCTPAAAELRFRAVSLPLSATGP